MRNNNNDNDNHHDNKSSHQIGWITFTPSFCRFAGHFARWT